jgi:hypothetical protein
MTTPFITAKMATLMPRLVTRQEIIKDVPSRWKESYPERDRMLAAGRTAGQIEDALFALDLESATVDDVKRIIGNASWTELTCGICEMDRDAVISVPKEYDGPTLVCRTCADGISTMFAEQVQS